VDEEKIGGLLDRLASDSALEFRGIHLFAGTQILDGAVLIAQYRKGLEVARWVAQQLGRPLATIDFGGGLGIPYFPHEQELDLEQLSTSLNEMMEDIRRDPLFAGTAFIVEPGRFLVGESGIYVARVNDIKVSRGKTFLILDGGMNHHLAASGNLGQVIKRNFPVAILNKLDQDLPDVVDVVGPLCTPLDTLARDINLPPAEVGDLVGVFQSGAYARAASPLGFLSHLTPPEVMVENGQVREIRKRGTYDSLMFGMS
jgi:diaminopimelate decarboxylase